MSWTRWKSGATWSTGRSASVSTWSRGTISTCPGNTGRRSRKASAAVSSNTTSAGSSPATMAQKTQRSARAVGIGASWLMPRIAPLPIAEWDEELKPLGVTGLTAPDGSPLNIFGTLANHPKLLKRWLVFANHVLAKSTLTPRDRELLILRAGWNNQAPYEWGQHVAIALRSDISQEEIDRVAAGPDAPGWDPFDADAPAPRRRAAREGQRHRCDVGDARGAVLDRTAHGRRVRGRAVHAGLVCAERVRRRTRSRASSGLPSPPT